MRLIYQIHKWIGVGIGVILLMWIVTGMLVGGGRGEKPNVVRPVDVARAVISPAQAALAVASDSSFGGVKGMSLDQLGSRPVYRVTSEQRAVRLIDAATGAQVQVDEALAREIAATELPGVELGSVERIKGGGPQSGWRVRFHDADHTVLIIGERSGEIRRTDDGSQFHRSMMSLHTFAVLKGLSLPAQAVYIIFLSISIISLGTVLTGYYLSLPKRWRLWGASAREN